MRRIFIILLFAGVLSFTKALAIAVPGDPITIEAFISLHKMTHEKEVEVRNHLAEMAAIQVVVKMETEKTEDKIELLHSKMKDAQSWMMLASTLSSLGIEILDTAREVETFCSEAPALFGQSVFCLTLYGETIYNIQNLVRQSIKELASLELANVNILRASTKQKLQFIYCIKGRLSQIQSMMSRCRWLARWQTGRQYTFFNIQRLVSSEAMRELMNATITFWRNRH